MSVKKARNNGGCRKVRGSGGRISDWSDEGDEVEG